MFNGKYLSVNTVINAAYRDSGMIISNRADAIEWAAEAIELIGGIKQMEDVIKVLLINDYKCKVPCETHIIYSLAGFPNDEAPNIEECEIQGSSFIPMKYSTNTFHNYKDNSTNNPYNSSDLTYIVNNDHIFTNFEKGFILLDSKNIPVDEDGFPKIPDDIKFVNAVKYHIMWKLAFLRMMEGKISAQAYEIIERDRNWYIGAAETRSQMGGIDEMESLKNNMIRMIPKINQHATGFAGASSEEKRYIHNNGSYYRDSFGNQTYYYSR